MLPPTNIRHVIGGKPMDLRFQFYADLFDVDLSTLIECTLPSTLFKLIIINLTINDKTSTTTIDNKINNNLI
ncbi:unnamed protein product [Rotaria sp. Silwood1]|nr:unnamed protein product [Rotaria sp. Silwood1]CAF1463097.1 unnamed protein product [Rotaria sp. Silwood1]CAF1486352.1 unnamed protein product [Rotaria sp. Silwood1]CAF3666854.1 unnamed protein product [Rotaria sp. Silwood1]CAF3673982.1 unnamed protein product [Rotaria sp. Silwood1]